MSNALFDDPKLLSLVQDLEEVNDIKELNRWKKSFLARYETFLDKHGQQNAQDAFAALCRDMPSFLKVIQNLMGCVESGELSTECCTTQAYRAMSDLQAQLKRICSRLVLLSPFTTDEEEMCGYTQFDIGAVLVRDGFREYARLEAAHHIIQQLYEDPMSEVADRQILSEMEQYEVKLGHFYTVMADVGFERVMEKTLELRKDMDLFLTDSEEDDEEEANDADDNDYSDDDDHDSDIYNTGESDDGPQEDTSTSIDSVEPYKPAVEKGLADLAGFYHGGSNSPGGRAAAEQSDEGLSDNAAQSVPEERRAPTRTRSVGNDEADRANPQSVDAKRAWLLNAFSSKGNSSMPGLDDDNNNNNGGNFLSTSSTTNSSSTNNVFEENGDDDDELSPSFMQSFQSSIGDMDEVLGDGAILDKAGDPFSWAYQVWYEYGLLQWRPDPNTMENPTSSPRLVQRVERTAKIEDDKSSSSESGDDKSSSSESEDDKSSSESEDDQSRSESEDGRSNESANENDKDDESEDDKSDASEGGKIDEREDGKIEPIEKDKIEANENRNDASESDGSENGSERLRNRIEDESNDDDNSDSSDSGDSSSNRFAGSNGDYEDDDSREMRVLSPVLEQTEHSVSERPALFEDFNPKKREEEIDYGYGYEPSAPYTTKQENDEEEIDYGYEPAEPDQRDSSDEEDDVQEEVVVVQEVVEVVQQEDDGVQPEHHHFDGMQPSESESNSDLFALQPMYDPHDAHDTPPNPYTIGINEEEEVVFGKPQTSASEAGEKKEATQNAMSRDHDTEDGFDFSQYQSPFAISQNSGTAGGNDDDVENDGNGLVQSPNRSSPGGDNGAVEDDDDGGLAFSQTRSPQYAQAHADDQSSAFALSKNEAEDGCDNNDDNLLPSQNQSDASSEKNDNVGELKSGPTTQTDQDDESSTTNDPATAAKPSPTPQTEQGDESSSTNDSATDVEPSPTSLTEQGNESSSANDPDTDVEPSQSSVSKEHLDERNQTDSAADAILTPEQKETEIPSRDAKADFASGSENEGASSSSQNDKEEQVQEDKMGVLPPPSGQRLQSTLDLNESVANNNSASDDDDPGTELSHTNNNSASDDDDPGTELSDDDPAKLSDDDPATDLSSNEEGGESKGMSHKQRALGPVERNNQQNQQRNEIPKTKEDGPHFRDSHAALPTPTNKENELKITPRQGTQKARSSQDSIQEKMNEEKLQETRLAAESYDGNQRFDPQETQPVQEIPNEEKPPKTHEATEMYDGRQQPEKQHSSDQSTPVTSIEHRAIGRLLKENDSNNIPLSPEVRKEDPSEHVPLSPESAAGEPRPVFIKADPPRNQNGNSKQDPPPSTSMHSPPMPPPPPPPLNEENLHPQPYEDQKKEDFKEVDRAAGIEMHHSSEAVDKEGIAANPKMYTAAVIEYPGALLRLEQRPIPVPGNGQVLIKVSACGICHSDSLTQQGNFPGVSYPRVPGHEAAGEVVALGPNVEWPKLGSIVGVGWHGGHCLTCKSCRSGKFMLCKKSKVTGVHIDGGFQEYCLAHWTSLIELPKRFDPVRDSPLLGAAGAVFHGLQSATDARPGDVVGIQGIGGVGHIAIQFARKMGYRVVAISSSPDKEEDALKFGAHVFINMNSQKVARKLQKLGGAKLIIATAPDSKVVEDLLPGLALNGRLLTAGIDGERLSLSPNQLIFSHAQVLGLAPKSPRSVEEASEFAIFQDIEVVTEIYPLEQAQEAYDRMISGRARYRVVLEMRKWGH